MDAIWVFKRAVRRGPDRLFAFDRVRELTYGEGDRRSDSIASALDTAGLSPGDPVALSSPDSVSLLVAILGAWKAGLQPSLIDARTSDADLPYFVEDIGAKVVCASEELRDRLIAAGAPDVLDLETLGTDEPGQTHIEHGADAPLYLSYTSGTTGRPKGALLRSGPVTVGTACIADRLGLVRDDILLAATPSASSFQLVAALLPAIHVGATLGLVAGLPPAQIWEVARRYRASVLVAYPLTLADVVNAPAVEAGPAPFRVAMSGGSPLAPRIKRDYGERLRIPLLESYGQSEFGGFMALGSPSETGRSLEELAGRPLPDRPAYVADPAGRELPAGEIGEVMVPFGYFDRYVNKPSETAATLADGLLHCGDLGVSDDERRIKVLGRTGERAAAERRGGFLRDLEDAFYEHPDVLHAAAVECRDGEVEGFAELLPGRSLQPDDLWSFASSRVSPGLRPSTITFLEKLPRTFSGKVNRLALSRGCGA